MGRIREGYQILKDPYSNASKSEEMLLKQTKLERIHWNPSHSPHAISSSTWFPS